MRLYAFLIALAALLVPSVAAAQTMLVAFPPTAPLLQNAVPAVTCTSGIGQSCGIRLTSPVAVTAGDDLTITVTLLAYSGPITVYQNTTPLGTIGATDCSNGDGTGTCVINVPSAPNSSPHFTLATPTINPARHTVSGFAVVRN